ncbi:type II secretion system protein E [Thermaerobacter marianensis DSM 12885]|uniref:Type II secretion system protein E n=1 Tax=Thermaerobacter marianensis (strain ATCC 700841 / DSM 12885 / JCM 10246 / 7p75a) TaxID=644966 RepID=E6SL90_THEM7|nr:CpaF family protein [Thermaerobacter marianensis]ADU51321.1 type II secretion system protein E [Thermaerobacter marianensis DSM 12885]
MGSSLYQRLKDKPWDPVPEPEPERGGRSREGVRGEGTPGDDPHRALKNRIQLRLIDEVDARVLVRPEGPTEEQRAAIRAKILGYLAEEESVSPLEREDLAETLMAEILGYGPIEPLLRDPEVSEIMINGRDQVYVERRGRLERVPVQFEDDRQILHLIEKIVAPLGRRIDEASPMVDARLPDGSRVNAIIPPLALRGPCLTIRKFSRDPLGIDDLIRLGTLSAKMAVFLEAAVRGRLNIIVSGGTGSGKTTTLNVLSSFIPPDERIITIEDAAELQLQQEHVVSLETRPPNIEGRGEVTIRQLVRNSLRMRPDRIVVGEVRSGEALDMLQAMNTGHDGSLTTAHANSPRDLLSRLETMVLMAGIDLPVRAIREQIASALDLIVHQSRFKDGTRKITHITEVQGMEGDVIVLQDLFRFQVHGVDTGGRVRGEFVATGIRPRCQERLEAAGIELPPGLFD